MKPSNPALYRLSAHAGSLRTTLALFALLAAVVFARPDFVAVGGVLLLLGLNLAAALVVHPVLRRQGPLLVAHLALLALVLVIGWGRLASLDGRFELTQGEVFDGTLLDVARGPLNRSDLAALAFGHDGFEIDYAPGRRRGATRNAVHWRDDDGRPRRAVIGDHRPLVLNGHRISTSPNKGFAPVLTWEPAGAAATERVVGAVHLPSFPLLELKQSQAWRLPDGREAWVRLEIDETLIDPARTTRFEMPRRHRLVVRVDEARAELTPGGALTVAGGTLRYLELRTWMGYRIAHDPSLPWALAAALLASAAFALHYGLHFALHPAGRGAGRMRSAVDRSPAPVAPPPALEPRRG